MEFVYLIVGVIVGAAGLFVGCEKVCFFAIGVTDEPTACPGFVEGGKGTY